MPLSLSTLPPEPPYRQLRGEANKESEVIEPVEVYRCSAFTVNGKMMEGCGLETRARRFVFETESWLVRFVAEQERGADVGQGRVSLDGYGAYEGTLSPLRSFE